MKKTILSVILMTFAIAALHAQNSETALKKDIKSTNHEEKQLKKEKKAYRKKLVKLEDKDVSPQAKTQFQQDFSGVSNVSWKRSNFYDEASFVQNGQKMTAYYDDEADLVGTITSKSINDIPERAKKEITARYKDYNIQNVVLFDDNENNDTDMYIYGLQFDDADNYFAELKKDNKDLILQISMKGDVSFFKELK